MPNLSEDLKRMLSGLAYQDAGDFLSRSEKMKILNGRSEDQKTDSRTKSVATLQKDKTAKVETLHATNKVTPRHIAFISNGDGINAPLDYAIESSLRQNAQIDLLIHGNTELDKVVTLEKKISDAGVHYQKIQLGENAVKSIVDYVVKQPSLIYIITTPVDTVAKALIEAESAKRNRIHVPFVLIKDEITPSTLKQTAA